nr:MFS transporter [Pseudoduganella ginsengisoli]
MRHIVTMMAHIAAGDFRQRPPPPPGAPIAGHLHGLAENANRSYDAVLRDAEAQRRLAPLAAAQAEPVLRRLKSLYTFGSTSEGDLVAHRVVLVRVLSFLFMFAEMLSRSFLPVYAASLPAPGLDSGMRASLPITAFLLGVALTMPFAGAWSDRLGRRSSYIAGALTVMAGLAVTGLVPDYLALVVARAVTGAGYAVMFMACQGYVFDHTDSSNRGKGMALFVGAIMVAEICSPAVGGILADRVGYRMVFLLGAMVALGAAALAAVVLRATQNPERAAAPAGNSAAPLPGASFALVSRLARNRRFVALSFLSGMPAKFLYSGFLIFLVPVLLSTLGHSKSEIGRYTMLYGLSSLALAPVFAHLADRYNAYARLVAAGGVLTGLGLLPVYFGASGDFVMLGIAALGVGQSMSISAQLVLVARVTREEARDAGTGPIVGLFRLLERLGAAAGPLVTGMLVARYGAPQAMLALGAFALLSSLAFVLVFMAATRVDAANAEGAAA